MYLIVVMEKHMITPPTAMLHMENNQFITHPNKQENKFPSRSFEYLIAIDTDMVTKDYADLANSMEKNGVDGFTAIPIGSRMLRYSLCDLNVLSGIELQNKSIIQSLIDRNVNLDDLLITSAHNGDFDMVERLINYGVDISIRNNSLTSSSKMGHLYVVQYLVKNGADVSTDNDLPLRFSAEHGHLKIVKYLVEHGADIHALNNLPLQLAFAYGHLNIVEYLVDRGANIHVNDNHILKQSVENGHLDVVKLIISHFNSKILYAIHFAVIHENVQTLINKFINDQKITILELQNSNIHLFVYIVLICDEYVILKSSNDKQQQFVNIITKLSMELQMKICNNIYNLVNENIKGTDFDIVFKNIVNKFTI